MPRVVGAAVDHWFRILILILAVELSAKAGNSLSFAEPPGPPLLTNLFQLRQWADHDLANVYPFRIVATVCDVDPTCGVLVLRDATGTEFIQGDFSDSNIQPGAMISFEAEGCALQPSSFGLAIVPRLVLVNGGIHGLKESSGAVFLHAGNNPITLEWFNHLGHAALKVEYEGPGVPRQVIPDTSISRAAVDPVTRSKNLNAGLDYRCYEGAFENLPDFASMRPIRAGFTANFDVAVRSRPEDAAVVYDGFLAVPRDGVYTFHVTSDDGSRLFVGQSSVRLRVLENHAAAPVLIKLPATDAERSGYPFVTVEGTVHFAGVRGTGGQLQMRVGNNDIRADIFIGGNAPTNVPPHAKVQVSGIYQDILTEDGLRVPGALQVCSWNRVRVLPSERTPAELIENDSLKRRALAPASIATNVLTTVEDIKALSPGAARKALPISIRGVVTTTALGSAVVQDSTRGIYVFGAGLPKDAPLHCGDLCQVEGVTSPGLFAPSIAASHITRLGAGQFPQPLRATWDQLVNGSLDTEYAELEGVVTAVRDQRLELLTEGGKIEIYLNDFRPDVLAGYVDALVRIRGCVFARFNEMTHKLEPGSLRVGDAAVEILQPARSDVFDVPRKSIAELLLYDPKATPFRLLKINGQVVYGQSGSYYLTDGTNGMHVTTRSNETFAVGDLVDAVGFLELGGPAAELNEAVMRKVGGAPLPTANVLTPDRLLLANLAGTLVRMDATLMNNWNEGADQVLELQSGFLAFRGRIHTRDKSISLPPPGSRLELTGVYAAQGSRLSGGKVSAFELLLYSPGNVRVLARPPWWNLKRLLILAGILGALLCVVLIWNKELQRKVQERTLQLEMEIGNRQRAELQRAAEAERSRIARDLHDELGAGLTEVSLLASTGFGDFRSHKGGDDRFATIAEKARALVSRLDVIVWAIDPSRNSLQSFADYVSSYAKEFLGASDVVCRLKIPIECEAISLGGTARHSLFLAIKESLNNIIRHAGATEVELQLVQLDARLEIIITDNGRGFDRAAVGSGHGLANIEHRLVALHGECHIQSQTGHGTTIKLSVPLSGNPE